jgi:hypothetical protein
MEAKTVRIWNGIKGQYQDVKVKGENYINEEGKALYRIETYGRYGKKKHVNPRYLNEETGRQQDVFGTGGSTGHGWGGTIVGYLTWSEISERKA